MRLHPVAAGIGIDEMPLWMGEREGRVRAWPQRRRTTDDQVLLAMHPDLLGTAEVQAVAELLSGTLKQSVKA